MEKKKYELRDILMIPVHILFLPVALIKEIPIVAKAIKDAADSATKWRE